MQVKKALRNIPVRYVKGVGPVKAELFGKMGVTSVSDLLHYLPRRYEDRTRIVGIDEISPGEEQGVIGEILNIKMFRAPTGTCILEVEIGDGAGKVSAVWYNQPFLKKVFASGQKILLYGRVDPGRKSRFSHPDYEIISGENVNVSREIGRIVPFYPLTGDVSQKYLRKIIFRALEHYAPSVADDLPTKIRARRKLVDARFALENIHFPHSSDNLEKAYRRLVFEEFFMLQVLMALRRKKIRGGGISHSVERGMFEDYEDLFPFNFTESQKKCIKEIESDMASKKTMYRLLQGDVGSGKTVVAMYALLITCKNGHQGALMAPTEVLARQHYVTASQVLMPMGLNVRLLVSGMGRNGLDKVKDEIMSGEADIVVGTHSLISGNVAFRDLGLAIVDEQHKFGVEQRKALRSKGRVPDILLMSATPIPRSLVMTVFGDMDVSRIGERPEGRKKVDTYWVEEEKREAVYSFIREEVKKGRQAFIVYPRIKDTGVTGLRSAEEMFEKLKDRVFRDLRVAVLHGRMGTDEKDRVMEGFRSGRYDIMVATTLIEVGVDIPNAGVMLIEHAERYGLAQLHQLRGRIGRGKHRSYCILMGAPSTEAAMERLATMEKTEDGFLIAEKDLDIRGPGEILGTRQSGLPELKVGDIARDFLIMEQAREEALALLTEDPCLADLRNSGVREGLHERFGKRAEGECL